MWPSPRRLTSILLGSGSIICGSLAWFLIKNNNKELELDINESKQDKLVDNIKPMPIPPIVKSDDELIKEINTQNEELTKASLRICGENISSKWSNPNNKDWYSKNNKGKSGFPYQICHFKVAEKYGVKYN